MPAGDEHGDALDPGAERRSPHARSHDCARAARFRVHRCQDVQVTSSGAFRAEEAELRDRSAPDVCPIAILRGLLL